MAAPEVIVAGHICLDIIPTFGGGCGSLGELLSPGKLVEVGPVILSTGGPVPNTGLAMHRLGVSVALMGKVGDDLFGRAILDLLGALSPELATGMIVAPGQATSYSVVISPPGTDRVFLHCPGTNDTFAQDDIPYATLPAARIFHFGYPPLMKRMYSDDGDQLKSIFRKIKSLGMTTSLDMARMDPSGAAAQAPWAKILEKVLPHVDVFVPSVDELLFMLDRPAFDSFEASGKLASTMLTRLSGQLLALGAAVVVLKLGDQGCYVRTTDSRKRLADMGRAAPGNIDQWVGREVLSPCFEVGVVGTTGAGDCTIAGFLGGLLHGLSAADALCAATAVGACSVEAADANSGVPSWQAVQARLAGVWKRRRTTWPLDGWREDAGGLFLGPADTVTKLE
jgi:sugar/nucleoside kinase (ribokinase family)